MLVSQSLQQKTPPGEDADGGCFFFTAASARKSINFSTVFCVLLWRRRWPWPRIIRRPAEGRASAYMIDADERCGSAKKKIGRGRDMVARWL